MMTIEDLTNKQLLNNYHFWRKRVDEVEDDPNYSEAEKSYVKEQFEMAEKEALKRMAGGK